MSFPYNAIDPKYELTWEEEVALAAELEAEGELLPYLSDEDFAKLTEIEQERVVRTEQLKTLQLHYDRFTPFLQDVMYELGFQTTKIQADIGKFLEKGAVYRMIQAQRSQAKTTIAAAYVVWRLLHNPKLRVLIVSAGGSQAQDISVLIIRIIMNMDVLECIRPDKSAGDRVSVEKFDLHYSLRKLDKSASVSCCGITANLQGRRADLLLADDVETQKNSMTALMREQLLQKTYDFSSIVQDGEIVYLGTPQSSDSIYKTLPERGYDVRIWSGRFPTKEQLSYYGDKLAPVLTQMMTDYPQLMIGGGALGDQGLPIEPSFLGEELLQRKEKDQGLAWFQLQHMLNTALMDAERRPLKTQNIIAMPLRVGDDLPLEIKRGYDYVDYSVEGESFRFAKLHPHQTELQQAVGTVFYIDPAGGGKGKGTKGGDATGFACTSFLNSNLYVLSYGAFKGGYDDRQLYDLAAEVKRCRPTVVKIEKNHGYGAFAAVFLPVLREVVDNEFEFAVEEDYVSGQKELRIIDTLEPIIARGSLVINSNAITNEYKFLRVFPDTNRKTHCLLSQIMLITRERDSLIHDDVLDALAGSCDHWKDYLRIDQKKAMAVIQMAVERQFWKDPLQRQRIQDFPTMGGGLNMLRKRRNRR